MNTALNLPPPDDVPERSDVASGVSVPEALPPHPQGDADPVVASLPVPLPGDPPRTVRAISDFGSPLRWSDLVYLALFYVGAGFFLTRSVAHVAMLAFHFSLDVLKESVGIQASVLIVAQALLSGATLLFLYVLVRGRSSAPFWRALGWRPFGSASPGTAVAARYLLSGFALALLVGILGRHVGGSSPVPFEDMFRSRQSILLMTALGILVAPLVEETIFRGCIFPVIAGRFGVSVGVLVTGTLFGLAHSPQLGGDIGLVALLIVVGVILTYIRARAGTVAASYFVHVGYNSTIFLGVYLATGGLRHLPGS